MINYLRSLWLLLNGVLAVIIIGTLVLFIGTFDKKKKNDIIVEFDGTQLANINFNFIAQLSEVLSNDKELEVGEFQYQIFKVNINKLKTYEEENIVCEH